VARYFPLGPGKEQAPCPGVHAWWSVHRFARPPLPLQLLDSRRDLAADRGTFSVACMFDLRFGVAMLWAKSFGQK